LIAAKFLLLTHISSYLGTAQGTTFRDTRAMDGALRSSRPAARFKQGGEKVSGLYERFQNFMNDFKFPWRF
jgi:hypothetical protein